MSARDTGGTDDLPPGVDVDFSAAPALLRYTLKGDAPSPAAWSALRRHMVERGYLTRDTSLLVDARELTSLPSLSNLRSIMAAATNAPVLARAIAFLTGDPTQFGVGRQAEMLLPNGVTGAVFTDEREALAWCKSVR
jgi:hypothetical protein